MDVKELLAQSPEQYMSEAQLEFFRNLLIDKAAALQERIAQNQNLCRIERQADEADSASIEEARAKAARLIEMDMSACKQIKQALEAIKSGEYGYCAITGEPITLKRLLAVPESLLCVDAMRAREAKERHQRAA